MEKKKQRRVSKSKQTGETGTSSDYWQSIMNSIDDEIAVIDRDFRIVYANATVLRRYGTDKAKIIGRHCYELSHNALEPCAFPDRLCPANEVWKTGKSSQSIHVHRYETADAKEERYVEVKASPVTNSQGNITEIVMIIRDITEAKRMEQRILEANRNLLALNAIANTVSQSLDLDTILNSALDKVLELMKGNTGGILLLDNESQSLSYRVYRGLSEEFVKGIAGLKLGEGIAGLVAKQGKPIYVDNVAEDPRITRSVVATEGLRAFASVPLISKGRVLGVMNIASHALQRFTPEDVQLLSSISNQIAVAIENAKLYEELQRKETMRGELLHLVISTQEEERRRIARGLHDEISQALTSLAVNLEAVADALPLDTDEVKARLKKVQSIAIGTLDEIHKVIWELRPTLLDDLGLIPAVESYVETHLAAAGVRTHFETAGSERRMPTRVETAIFRIIQEALTNIVRHADAESASISIEFEDNSILVHIEDDGKGFDLEDAMRATREGRGLGLLSMKERAQLLGGSLNIKSKLGQGTQIDLEIPMKWEG
jgi:PAS domain S-box-containing protein